MADWIGHLERLIAAMDAPVLEGAGKVSHKQAVARAEGEYEKYRARMNELPSVAEEAYLDTIKQAQRQIEGK